MILHMSLETTEIQAYLEISRPVTSLMKKKRQLPAATQLRLERLESPQNFDETGHRPTLSNGCMIYYAKVIHVSGGLIKKSLSCSSLTSIDLLHFWGSTKETPKWTITNLQGQCDTTMSVANTKSWSTLVKNANTRRNWSTRYHRMHHFFERIKLNIIIKSISSVIDSILQLFLTELA